MPNLMSSCRGMLEFDHSTYRRSAVTLLISLIVLAIVFPIWYVRFMLDL